MKESANSCEQDRGQEHADHKRDEKSGRQQDNPKGQGGERVTGIQVGGEHAATRYDWGGASRMASITGDSPTSQTAGSWALIGAAGESVGAWRRAADSCRLGRFADLAGHDSNETAPNPIAVQILRPRGSREEHRRAAMSDCRVDPDGLFV
jgi:hypothetical protein